MIIIHRVVFNENAKLKGIALVVLNDIAPLCAITMYCSRKGSVKADNADVTQKKITAQITIHNFLFPLQKGKFDNVNTVSNCSTR